jgi:inner membrane protein
LWEGPMPSAFTHLLVGGATAQALPPELPRRRLAAAFALASAVPDLDVVAFALGIPYVHPLGHRGFSHSLLGAALFGGLVALAATGDRKLARRHLGALALAGFLAVASHGLLDAATDAGEGVGFFIPFSNERYFFPFRPIPTSSVDPARFFSLRGLRILASEALWVWLPLAGLSLAFRRVRRDEPRSRSGGAADLAGTDPGG